MIAQTFKVHTIIMSQLSIYVRLSINYV